MTGHTPWREIRHKKDESPFEKPRMEDLKDGSEGRLVRWFYIAWIVSLVVLVVLGLIVVIR